MLKFKESQKVLRNGFEISFRGGEEIVGHCIIGELSDFPFEFLGKGWLIFAETVGDVDEGCVDLVDVKDGKETIVFEKDFVDILTDHGHGCFNALQVNDITWGALFEAVQ